MGLRDTLVRWGLLESSDTVTYERRLMQESATASHLQERLSMLELSLEDQGWDRLSALTEHEFSRQGIDAITTACRLYAIKNPLIRRGIALTKYYVWGQGVEIAARDEQVDELIRAMTAENGSKRTLFSPEAHMQLEAALATDGNIFFTLPTEPLTGRVRVRVLPMSEISEIVMDSDDRAQPRFYKREFTNLVDTPEGVAPGEQQIVYHPDITYQPPTKPTRHGRHEIRWDQPVLHVAVGQLRHMRWGVAEVYAAIDWAKAHKEYLEDWSAVVRALRKFVWKAQTSPGQVEALSSHLTKVGEDVTQIGSAFVSDPNTQLQPVVRPGLSPTADDHRNLAMMVAAAMDLPYYWLTGDVDMGNHATAKTMDRPTELRFRSRQTLWSSVIERIVNYAVDQAALSPQGPFNGREVEDLYGNTEVELNGIEDRTVEVSFPELLEHDTAEAVESIVRAYETKLVPPETAARELLRILGIEEIDEVLEELDFDQIRDLQMVLPPGERPTGDVDADQDGVTREGTS